MNQRKYFRKSLYSLARSLINQQRHINERPLSFNLWHLYLFVCVHVHARVCVCMMWGGDKHLNGNEHRRWWTNHMIAFIIASYRGDIYTMTGNVMSYQSPTRAHMLWITVMHSAVGHVWCRLHSVRLRKTWSPWVNQCCTVFHLFHLNSSPKHYKSIIEKNNNHTLLEIHHLIYENKRPSLLKSYQFVN